MHVASTLGQLDGIPLDGIPLDGVKAYITGAKSVQELVDMPYPAEELAKVRLDTPSYAHGKACGCFSQSWRPFPEQSIGCPW